MLSPAYADELKRRGRAVGLAAVGVAGSAPFVGTRADLEARRAAGLHAGMHFTYGNPARSTDPAAALGGAAALVVAAWAYPRGGRETPARPTPSDTGPLGRVAAYARHDHYGELRAGLGVIARRLRADGWRARVLVDDNALVDREAAYRAGLGWYGKNANLLLSGRGSWHVLGSVVTSAPLPPDEAPVADGCGPCRRCLDGCPTGAIVAPGVVDARRCLSWLLQAPGDFPERYRAALGDRLYGCDDCQEVCPVGRHNVDPVGGGRERDGAGAFVAVLDLLDATDDELLARHGRFYIAGRDVRYLRRNALVVLGNSGSRHHPRVAATVRRFAAGEDDMLARHATWAARQLGLAGP